MRFNYRFNYGDNTINSRDIIDRLEELQGDLDELQENVTDAEAAFEAARQAENTGPGGANPGIARDQALAILTDERELLHGWLDSDEAKELEMLKEVCREGEDYSDWHYGETLIKYSYFVEYITELIDDAYAMPKEMKTGEWPYRHMTMDYEAAAAEAEQDYAIITINGDDYYIRS